MNEANTNSSESNIQIKEGKSASEVFYQILNAAANKFPETFIDLQFPENASSFKRQYVDFLPNFETARAKSEARYDIARLLADKAHNSLSFPQNGSEQLVSDYLQQDFLPLQLSTAEPRTKKARWPIPVYDGTEWQSLETLANILYDRQIVSIGAANALSWLEKYRRSSNNVNIDFSSRKVVALGANAEMASVKQFLEAGAHVLWIDKVTPPTSLIESPSRSGQLTWTEEADLLKQPGNITKSIIDFAEDDPIDFCLYAYAAGQAREFKLTMTMNAIIEALPDHLIRSIALLLSPTTATPLQMPDIEAIATRRRRRPAWEAALDKFGLLGKDNEENAHRTSRTLVSIQGTSYQAAQYLGKLMMAETWAKKGKVSASEPSPLRVSANTAAITRTRSMEHPVFAAAFKGATAFQVESFTPSQSQDLNGLLTIHDWLNPELPKPSEVRVHGAIHTLPYPLETALRVAAAIGFIRAPRLLRGLLINTKL